MKISILTENHAGLHTPAEHGLSYLIEYDGKKLLFDTGQSNLCLKIDPVFAGSYRSD